MDGALVCRLNDLEIRLNDLEEKLNACLILLKKATTHDNFVYTLTGKSPHWIAAMRAADKKASEAADGFPTGAVLF